MKNNTTFTKNQWEVFYLFKGSLSSKYYHKCEKLTITCLADALFKAGREPVRFISEQAEATRDKVQNYRPCYEHYMGRTESAKAIAKAIQRGKSDKFVLMLIKSRMRGHYTTSEENQILKQIDAKNPGITWRQAYEMAGVNLIPWVPQTARKFDYIIEGTTYESISDVADKYDLSLTGVEYRCKKDTFPDWIRKPIEQN